MLDHPDGEGVRELLGRSEPVGPAPGAYAPRWQIEFGCDVAGAPARIPAHQLNVLVVGAGGTGKPCAAGLIAERVVDPVGRGVPARCRCP